MTDAEIKTQKEIVLAAWLHDIGKFAQRSGKECYKSAMEEQLCPVWKGRYHSHQHVLYTRGVLDAWKNVLPDGINVSNVIELAASHHRPSTKEQWVIAKADRISSGSDRRSSEETEKSVESEVNRKFYEKPMEDILSTLHLDDMPSGAISSFSLRPLETDAVLGSRDSAVSKDLYASLWNFFEKDFVQLQGLPYDQFMTALETVLERYWWCIPSSTYKTDTDISLFQHAKTTAAFAECLYVFYTEQGTLSDLIVQNDTEKNDTEKIFLFLNGDMSGIQKYIFDLKTAKNSSKLLRARSFELWALSKIMAEYILHNLDLSTSNIVTTSGGKFLLSLPNTERIRKAVPRLKTEIQSYFLHEFNGKLAFVLSDGTVASPADVAGNDSSKMPNVISLINKIGYDADCAKQKKMQRALEKNGAVLDTLYDALQKNGACTCCGINAKEPDSDVCGNCRKLIETGRNLVKAAKIEFIMQNLQHFGQMVKIYGHDDPRFAYTVNTYRQGLPLLALPYVAPRKNGKGEELKTFEDLAEDATGNTKIAMFKADIDNLGLVFTSSLGNRMSFSRYADMSRLFHYFFSSYYAYFVSSDPEFKDEIYTVYSGGDDMCIIGPWNTVFDFAVDFHKKFMQFCNGNPSLTLSAGLVLSDPFVPVGRIAQKAEDALDVSKARKSADRRNIIKNAVTVFGTTVSWQDFEDELDKGKKLQVLLDNGRNNITPGLSTATVYKILDLAARAERIQQRGDIRDLLNSDCNWASSFYYMTARTIDENIKIDYKGEKVGLRDWFRRFGTSPDEIIKSRIAVSYALYTQRISRYQEEK
jgi:CRISPR-associated protein Csm1